MNNNFLALKEKIQLVIDLITEKNFTDAAIQLDQSAELLDEILDFAVSDADIVEVRRYQILLNQLRQKLETS